MAIVGQWIDCLASRAAWGAGIATAVQRSLAL